MQKVFEKIIEKLEERKVRDAGIALDKDQEERCFWYKQALNKAIEIVKQEAEKFGRDTNVGSNGWIPVSDRLPEEAFGCLVTVMDCDPLTQTEFENILPYVVGYDGNGWNDADGNTIPFEVIAWQPRPEPYQPEEI